MLRNGNITKNEDKQSTTQCVDRNPKRRTTRTSLRKAEVNSGACSGQAVPVSYKTSAMLVIVRSDFFSLVCDRG